MTTETTSTTLHEPVRAAIVRRTVRPKVVEAARPASPRVDHFPLWLRFVDTIHRADLRPSAIGADVVVAAGCALVAGVSMPVAAGLALASAFLVYLGGGYADRGPLETQGVLWFATRSLTAVALATLVGVTVEHIAGSGVGPSIRFGWSAAVGLILLRGFSWGIVAAARRRGNGLRRTLIIGGSQHARMLSHKLSEYPEAGLLPVAMLPLGNGHGYAAFLPEFPEAANLGRSIAEASVEHVVLAPDGADQAILECVKGSAGLDVSFSILPPLAEFFLHPEHVAQVGGLPLVPVGKIAGRRTALPGKRLFDLVGSSLLLLALSPVIAVTALAIKIFDGGPVIYRQPRVGRGGKMFDMLKFRSMVVGAERLLVDLRDQNISNGLLFKIHDDPRVTRVGQFIRRLSMDELPQLWNVVRGEMSLVGPRPLPVAPGDFDAVDDQRHTVLPGITGYWQIAGAHGLTYEEMIKLDLSYINNWSLWTDVRILARTPAALMHRRGQPC
ncbi:MAG: sugar transferase [Actinomycetota bacterium]